MTAIPRPAARRIVATLAGLALVTGLLAGVGSPPAGAVPLAPDIKGLQGFDTAGPTGYHRVIWGLQAGSIGGPIDGWQVERWDVEHTSKQAEYNIAFGQGPDVTVTGMADEVPFAYRVRAHNADGWSSWSGFEAVRVHTGLSHWFPYPNETELIRGSYRNFLNRNPAVGESSTAAIQMTDAATTVSFLNGLINRADRTKHRYPVIRLYLAYFDRAPEPAGLAYWVGRMNAGTASISSVSAFFAKSNEFKTIYDDLNNTEFVTLVYHNVLDRAPEPAGLAYWKGQLDQGKITRGKLMVGFSESAEGKTLRAGDAVVADLWAAMLDEPASNALLLAYGDHIRAGGTAGDLALFFLYLIAYPVD